MALWRIPRDVRNQDAARKRLLQTLANAPYSGRRLIVCGGSNFINWQLVHIALTFLHTTRGIAEIIERGHLTGVDCFAREWSLRYAVCRKSVPHDKALGPTALDHRDRSMLDEKPHGLVAFPGGSATQHLIALAVARNVPVWRPTDTNCR